MSESPWEDPDVQAWLKRANEELRPMIQQSAYTMALVSGEQPDSKQAVELGFMILLDKPIILAVIPGVQIPDHLARCADEIVEVDFEDSEGSAINISAAVQRLTEKLHSETHGEETE